MTASSPGGAQISSVVPGVDRVEVEAHLLPAVRAPLGRDHAGFRRWSVSGRSDFPSSPAASSSRNRSIARAWLTSARIAGSSGRLDRSRSCSNFCSSCGSVARRFAISSVPVRGPSRLGELAAFLARADRCRP